MVLSSEDWRAWAIPNDAHQVIGENGGRGQQKQACMVSKIFVHTLRADR